MSRRLDQADSFEAVIFGGGGDRPDLPGSKPAGAGAFLRSRLLPIILVVGSSAASVANENAWLRPERFGATPGATLWVEARRGTEFAASAQPVGAADLTALEGRLDGEALMIAPTSGPQFLVTLPRPGVAVLRGQIRDQQRSVPRNSIERYLQALHASDEIRAAWQVVPTSGEWRERISWAIKAFVRVGEPDLTDLGWKKPGEWPIELVPEQDPTQLRADERFSVKVFRNGRPAAGVVITFLSWGEDREHVCLSDHEGTATARLDYRGVWRIEVVGMRQTSPSDWQTSVMAMTVETR